MVVSVLEVLFTLLPRASRDELIPSITDFIFGLDNILPAAEGMNNSGPFSPTR